MTTRGQMTESAEHEGGHTELMCAALEGETEKVERLLQSRTNINEQDDEGRTALMFAVTNIHRDTAKRLLEQGADVNAAANDGSTALMLAASAGDAEIVRDLLSKGADLSAKFSETGTTALMLAKRNTLPRSSAYLRLPEPGNNGLTPNRRQRRTDHRKWRTARTSDDEWR